MPQGGLERCKAMMHPSRHSSTDARSPVITTHLKPHPSLSEWVSHYWQIEGHSHASECHSFQRLVPGLNAAFIVQLGDPVDVLEGGRWTNRPTAFAEGHFHSPFHLRFAGNFRLVGISFIPGRIHSFLR